MSHSLPFASHEDHSTWHSLRGKSLSPSFESLTREGMGFFRLFAPCEALFESHSLRGMRRQLLCGYAQDGE